MALVVKRESHRRARKLHFDPVADPASDSSDSNAPFARSRQPVASKAESAQEAALTQIASVNILGESDAEAAPPAPTTETEVAVASAVSKLTKIEETETVIGKALIQGKWWKPPQQVDETKDEEKPLVRPRGAVEGLETVRWLKQRASLGRKQSRNVWLLQLLRPQVILCTARHLSEARHAVAPRC